MSRRCRRPLCVACSITTRSRDGWTGWLGALGSFSAANRGAPRQAARSVASLMVATAILLESSLSFLGLGDPNIMSWGYMIGAARTVIRTAWWLSFIPGVAILLTVLSLNLIGEGLNDALNPRLARKGR